VPLWRGASSYRLAAGVGAPSAACIPRLGLATELRPYRGWHSGSGDLTGSTENQHPPKRGPFCALLCKEDGYILPDVQLSCQLHAAHMGENSAISTPAGDALITQIPGDTRTTNGSVEQMYDYSGVRVPSSRSAAQTVEHTASRRSGPRRWLRAVEWVVAAGLHPRAGATTLDLAQDLAARMDYDTGHVRYCRDETAARLGVDRSTVARHAKYLREAGLLVWAQGGSRRNVRSLLGLPGYAATATVYAAVIPESYDVAMGRTRIGSGYNARVIVDMRGHGAASETPGEAVDNSSEGPVDNPASGSCAPPSLTVVKESGSVQEVDGFKDTSRKRASRPTASISLPTQKTGSRPAATDKDAGNSEARRSPAQVAQDCWIAAQVRPRVNWTQGENLRRLAYALRPLIDRGLDAHDIAAELHTWMLNWRPARPAAYIRAQLAEQTRLEAERAAATDPMDNAAWRAMVDQQAADIASLEALFALAPESERTDDDRRAAREAGWHDLPGVAEHYDTDPDDALDLYGSVLCARAVRMTASGSVRF